MNKISSKLIILLSLSSLIPMVLFGLIAIWTARDMAARLVVSENVEVAKRAANQINQYIENGVAILDSLAQNLGKTDLKDWQKERIVRNYAVQFEQFEAIDLVDRFGDLIATSRFHPQLEDQLREAAVRSALSGEVHLSKVFISQNYVPSLLVAIPVKNLGNVQGSVLGELNLIEMWRLVDSIQVGNEGYAYVVSEGGLLIAHGLESEKPRVLAQDDVGKIPMVRAALDGQHADMIYQDAGGVERIGVGVRVPELGWALVIEQPTREAYIAASTLTNQLTFLIGVFLLTIALVGTIGGRRYIVRPIRELITGTRAVSTGKLDMKVRIHSRDEFQELGEAFNVMTERLGILQEDIRRNERAVLFGKIATGLVHDLKHPIKNLENALRLYLRDPDNRKIRQVTQDIAAREFSNLNRFLDDLLHLARPTPLQPIPIGVNRILRDVLEPYRTRPGFRICWGQDRATTPDKDETVICVWINPPDLRIKADLFGLERVLRNLLVNGFEAMPKGGKLVIRARRIPPIPGPGGEVQIEIVDTGDGIPPERLRNLFVDFSTTKRRGIGLGLAISKKIVKEHGGEIELKSEPGKGTTVFLLFPAGDSPA